MRNLSSLFRVMIVLGLTLSLGVNAQNPFDWQRSADGRPFVSAQSDAQEAVRVSGTYSPTIYAVGTDEVPSDAYNPYAETQGRSNKPGLRGGFDTPDDPNQSNESPVGEAWVLIAFAAVFAVWQLRRRKANSAK